MRCLSALIFTGLAALTPFSDASALVRANKGPAFLLNDHPTSAGRISQRALLASYALWNASHDLENISLQHSIAVDAKKFSFASFELPHNDLTTGFLDFGYKDAKGIYHDWDFVRTEFGYCHGMTVVTRNFAYFARFDASLPAPYDYEKDPKEWTEYYAGLIDSVMENKVTVIPGFTALPDFSRSPMRGYIQRHVADQWGLNTARLATFQNVYETNFKPMATQGEVDSLRARLAAYLARGFYPRIVLGSGRYSVKDPHVVMMMKLNPPDVTGCTSFEFFNVGVDGGGHVDALKFCVGDRAWIPEDEDTFLYDFTREILGTDPQKFSSLR